MIKANFFLLKIIGESGLERVVLSLAIAIETVRVPSPGRAPNDGFLLNPLKSLLRFFRAL